MRFTSGFLLSRSCRGSVVERASTPTAGVHFCSDRCCLRCSRGASSGRETRSFSTASVGSCDEDLVLARRGFVDLLRTISRTRESDVVLDTDLLWQCVCALSRCSGFVRPVGTPRGAGPDHILVMASGSDWQRCGLQYLIAIRLRCRSYERCPRLHSGDHLSLMWGVLRAEQNLLAERGFCFYHVP